MKQAHNFPPFEHECINYDGLVEFVQGKLAKFECVYCHISFHSEESVRQHMNDLGHAKLNIENFG
jgi:NAD-dependent SIR2 family protein deacetylase